MADDKPKPDEPQWVPMTPERFRDLAEKGFGPPINRSIIVEDREVPRSGR